MWPALKSRWQNLLYGFWFVPGVIVFGFAVAAVALVRFDRIVGPEDTTWVFGGDASAARDILSTVAAAVATIAGVVFSITIVTLQLVSSQFSPRALRGFLKDRVTQLTAGVYVGTFVFCLLVMRTVRDADNGGDFVPAASITIGIALGLLSLVLLLVFVHHVASIVQVSSIAARLGRDTLEAVERLYPEGFGAAQEEASAEEAVAEWGREGDPVVARPRRAGYVQVIGLDDLVGNGSAAGARLHVRVRPGDFVTGATSLVEAWGWDGDGDELEKRVRQAIAVTDQRDVRQDVAFGLRQLTDIAVRALSPSLNDPTTAVTCIGHVRAILERLVERRLPQPVRRFDGDVTVASRISTFADYVEEAYAQLARHAAREPRVAATLLQAIRWTAERGVAVGAPDRVETLVEVAEAAAEAAFGEAPSTRDRATLARELEDVRSVPRPSEGTPAPAQTDGAHAVGSGAESA